VGDGLGSAVAETDPASNFTRSSIFDAWGATRSETGARLSPFTYTDREIGEAGTLFYRARYYQPGVGRFTQEDPKGFRGGDPNFYAYVSGDPVRFKDPSGHIRIHGNWCGPNWTGGQEGTYLPGLNQFYKSPVDAVDAVCEEHDKCYYGCRSGFPCSQRSRQGCMRQCDYWLVAELNLMRGPTAALIMHGIAIGNAFAFGGPDAGPNGGEYADRGMPAPCPCDK